MCYLNKVSFIFVCCIFCSILPYGKANSDDLNEFDEDSKANEIGLGVERGNYALKRGAVIKLPKYGLLQGSIGFTSWTNRTIYQFLNVPYAESPSGNRRFKAPVPVKPWNGIRNAEDYGTKCPVLSELKEMSQSERDSKDLEDCLIMAVFSTNLNASRPVMVYIHGGSFTNNNADQFPPNYLLERDIVLVVVQFRLDALGFLSTQSQDIPGNAGLMDSVEALKFVKENIEYFGGDPKKITVFGQSSGAAMVSALVISPSIQEDLFQKAIIQSGSIFADWACTNDPILDARSIAQAAGINAYQPIATLNRAFMSMKVIDLLDAVEKYQAYSFIHGKYPHGGRSLSIGGPNNLLPDFPENIIKSSKSNRSIPIIIGTTKDDGSYVATMVYDLLAATNKLNDKNFMVNDLIDTICRFSGTNDETGTLSAMASLTYLTADQLLSGDFVKCAPGIIGMLTTYAFKAPALKFAQMNAHKKDPLGTFVYTFDYQGEHTRYGYGANVSHYPFSGGVHHSDDLIYLFPYPPNDAKLNKQDTKIAQLMVDLWTSFATSGVPEQPKSKNGINALQWQPFIGPLGTYLHIDKDLQSGNDFRKEFIVQVRDQKTSTAKNQRDI